MSVGGSQRPLSYRPEIDGLRALAVLSVVGFHYFPEIVPGGFIGVDLFFVISGFLISSIIWDAVERGDFSFPSFYASRVRRIFPALALVLCATWVLGRLLLFWEDFARVGLHILAGAFFFSNFALWDEGGYFDVAAERKPLLHLWSLSIEEQFYVFWPLLLCLLARFRIRFWPIGVAMGVMSFMLDESLLGHDRAAAFYNPAGRIWELIAGALVGSVVRSRGEFRGRGATALSMLALFAIASGIALFDAAVSFPGALALVPVGAAAALLFSAGTATMLGGVLRSRGAVAIGLISYPLYLWHWPLFSYAYRYFHGEVPLEVRLGLIAGSLLLAAGTYLVIEKPIRRARGNRLLVILLVSVVGGVGILGGMTFGRRGFVASSDLARIAPYLTEPTRLAEWLSNVRAGTCHIQEINVGRHPAECIETKRPLILLWGDSHAAALYPGLATLQKTQGFGLSQMTSSGCPPLPRSYSVAYSRCDEINTNVLKVVAEVKPEVVILASSWRHAHLPSSETEIVAKLTEQIKRLRERAPEIRIIVVGPLMRWDPGLAQVLAGYVQASGSRPPLRLPRQETADNQKRQKLSLLLKQMSAQEGVAYISPDEYFCDQDGCLTRFGDSRSDFVSFDGEHLNPRASKIVADAIAPLLPPSKGQ
jgi:peptidoglycan/LPS O-acetylase OafA/YrhL